MNNKIKTKYFKFMQSFAKIDGRSGKKNEEYDAITQSKKFVGKDLKKIRKQYNISQRCFAEMLDMSLKTLQNYEIDHRAIPSASRSLFIFAGENMDVFQKYYLSKVRNLEPYRSAMNK